MKEDILEQLVEDWLVSQPGWFVKHNLRFRPHRDCEGYVGKHDAVHSDIDILAVSGTVVGRGRVMVVNCKSYQGGFKCTDGKKILESEAMPNDRTSGKFVPRERWKSYRELVSPKWMDAFLSRLELETGQRDFVYTIAVTKIVGTEKERKDFEQCAVVRERFEARKSKMELKLLSLGEILRDFQSRLDEKDTPVLESTGMGRLLQLASAADIRLAPSKTVP